MSVTPVIPAAAARRLLLGGQKLLTDPAQKATPAALSRLIGALGFVQLDSINAVARAHDLILWSRLDGYTPGLLDRLLARDRKLFEHWTHDASAIPLEHYAHWKRRFRRDAVRLRENAWWRSLLGDDGDRVVDEVRARIEREGPLRSTDFEHPERRGAWWGWKPQKAALDYLWRSGELAVRERVHFNKVYDLAARTYPTHHALPETDDDAHREWACTSAAERLVVFSPSEIAAFWAALDLAEAKAFCAAAVRAGRLIPVRIESEDGTEPAAGFALADWQSRLARLPEAPDTLRLLAPFDPVIRDRARCLRRFGFDYRFEAFTPREQRRYGYYVLPMLDGEQMVGRVSPVLDRARSLLTIEGVWWEPGIRPTRTRKKRLTAAAEHLAAFVGATQLDGL